MKKYILEMKVVIGAGWESGVLGEVEQMYVPIRKSELISPTFPTFLRILTYLLVLLKARQSKEDCLLGNALDKW